MSAVPQQSHHIQLPFSMDQTPWRCTQDVLSAAGQNLEAAAWMLSELHAPNTPGVSPATTPSASPLRPRADPKGHPASLPLSPARAPSSRDAQRGAEQPRGREGPAPDEETYWRERVEALQLTRQWQKAAHRATSSYASAHLACPCAHPTHGLGTTRRDRTIGKASWGAQFY